MKSVDDLINGNFNSDEFIDLTNKMLSEDLGNAFIIDRRTLMRLQHIRNGTNGKYLVQGNKLLRLQIVIVKEPCFMLGVIELN
jgi:hypothetical protein